MTDDVVFVLTSRHRAYHTDPDCVHVTDGHREWPLERAESYNLSECKRCAGTDTQPIADFSLYQAAKEAGEHR